MRDVVQVVRARAQAGPSAVPTAGRRDPDWERALLNPAAVFGTVRAVLDHPRLMRGFKREILRRWAWDEHLKEVAATEGMTAGEPSCLDEVRAALLSLDAAWRPQPSAPAAAIPFLREADDRLAA